MLIILDLDYTLLKSDGSLSERTVAVLKKCKEKGHKIVINSARSLLRSLPIAKEINADYINCFFGNLVVDKNEKVIYSRALDGANLKNLINEFQSLYSGFIGIEGKDGSYSNSKEAANKFGAKAVKLEELYSKDAFKLIFEIYEEHHEAAKKVAEKYNLDINFAREGYFCRLLCKNTNKWHGIQQILKLEPNEKTIAFGDEITDLETLNNCDIAVAMENSTEEFLNKLKNPIVTASNDEDGVAKYLEENIL